MAGKDLIREMNNKLIHFSIFFIFLFFSYGVYANLFMNKTLACSTEKFPLKGGFKFINNSEVDRYNILLNHITNKEYISHSSHCYILSEHLIAISNKSLQDGCGGYSSFIDINTLEFSRPVENIVLTANCYYFQQNLLQALEEIINN